METGPNLSCQGGFKLTGHVDRDRIGLMVDHKINNIVSMASNLFDVWELQMKTQVDT